MLKLPKYLTTEYASTPSQTVALHNNQFIIHTEYPAFIAIIEKGKLIPVGLLGHIYPTAVLQAALEDCAENFGQEFAALMDSMLDDDNGEITAIRLDQGFNLEALKDKGQIPYRSKSDDDEA